MVDVKKYRKLFQSAQEKPEYWSEIAVNEFTEDLAALLKQLQLTQADYANLLGASPAYVSKVFNGSPNFTLATMSKLAQAVDAVVHVHVARKGMIVRWYDELSCNEAVGARFEGSVRKTIATFEADSATETRIEKAAWASNG